METRPKIYLRKDKVSPSIAIVGIACRFPGADDYLDYWNNLEQGKNSIQEIPDDRWQNDRYYSPDFEEPNKSISKWAGLLPNIDLFDNQFFSIPPKEANNMDPHQRLLLEETVHCIEDSGVSLTSLRKKKTSVFVGATELDYYLEAAAPGVLIDRYACLGNFPCFLANRLSYAFGFKGQSMSLDAACASSLTVIHEGRLSLSRRECDYAVAASACLISHPWKFISFSKARALSPDGQCKTFDKDANGFVPGEGVGVLLLQRLDDALKCGSHIYGIIRGSAVNHGGMAQSLPAPNASAQREVIKAAYEDARISPETVTYVEAHGTATPLGDPIEIEGLCQAFREYTSLKQYCKIGSVKTNIGHLGPAAGMASVIKVLLMMRHRKIPKTLNFRSSNPIIDFENSPFSVVTESIDWLPPTTDVPLRAGVSSFGLGGSNAHILLESYDDKRSCDTKSENTPNLFLLSAKSKRSLEKLILKWRSVKNAGFIEETSLRDISYTLMAGREHFRHRYGFLARNRMQFNTQLDESVSLTSVAQKNTKLWCVRFGNLPPYSFSKALSLNNLMSRHLERAVKCLHKLKKRKITKKVPTVIGSLVGSNKALSALLIGDIYFNSLLDLGFKPALMTGKKTGVWASLISSGIVELEDIVAVLIGQKKIGDIQSLRRPRIPFYDPVGQNILHTFCFDTDYVRSFIYKIKISEGDALFYMEKASVLNENLSAFKRYLADWEDLIKSTGKSLTEFLSKNGSQTGQRGADRKVRLLQCVIIASAIRNVNRRWNLPEQRIIRNARFYELLDLIEDGVMTKDMFVRLLSENKTDTHTFVKQLIARQALLDSDKPYKYLRSKSKKLHEIEDPNTWIQTMLESKKPLPQLNEDMACLDIGSLGGQAPLNESVVIEKINDLDADFKPLLLKLWLKGVDVDWSKLCKEENFIRTALPGYAFDRRHFWRLKKTELDNTPDSNITGNPFKLHPLIDSNVSTLQEQKFTIKFQGNEFYIADHIVMSQKILPGVACLEMAKVSGRLSGESKIKKISDIVWIRPIVLSEGSKKVFLNLYPFDQTVKYEIAGYDENLQRIVYSQGRLVCDKTNSDEKKPQSNISRNESPEYIDIKKIRERLQFKKSQADCYRLFHAAGIEYGTNLRAIQELSFNEREALSIVKLPPSLASTFSNYDLHPTLMDAAIQTAIGINGNIEKMDAPLFPFSLREVVWLNPLSESCYAFASLNEQGSVTHSGLHEIDICLIDKQGKVSVAMTGLTLRASRNYVTPTKNAASQHLFHQKQKKQIMRANENKTVLKERAEFILRRLLSMETQQHVDEIDPDVPFEDFGIDSVMILSLTRGLEMHYGELSKTLFFEFRNISELSDYFVKNYKDKLQEYEMVETAPKSTSEKKDLILSSDKVAADDIVKKVERTNRSITDVNTTSRDIAVIGLAGQYPMAKNLDEFWDNLKAGKDCIREIPRERWDYRRYYDPDKSKKGKIYSKWGGFIDDIDKFDPLFFNISPKDAELIDPQERLFLETVYHALEDAGYTSTVLEGSKTGVFVGAMWSEYQLFGVEESLKGNLIAPTSQIASIANRVSYFFNFQGPSIGLDTMCSSSLAAIHLAIESIRKGDIDMAVAGGVNISVHPSKYIFLCRANFASSDGRCRSFGEGGDGYVPGEGVGAVLLKPLDHAISDNDHIYAVIKACSINHGGKTNGYTVPNPNAQSDLILKVVKDCGYDPRTISYIETHGTGTALGDPIEINALTKAFGHYTNDKQFCSVGSVKSNIGHLESAAGIAALTKVLLQLKNKQLVPSINSNILNRNINFKDSPFSVQQELKEWKRPIIEKNGMPVEYPRRAGISSFGAGGSNAHLILEEYVDKSQNPKITPKGRNIIVISAKNEERLAIHVKQFVSFLENETLIDHDDFSLENIAYTLQTGRVALQERLAVIAESIQELRIKLVDYLDGKEKIDNFYEGRVEKGNISSMTLRPQTGVNDNLDNIAMVWASGGGVDWGRLYSDSTPKRISLPVYPFERGLYWIPKSIHAIDPKDENKSVFPRLHPFIETNTSTLEEQKYTTLFRGDEFYLTDHLVNGQRVLPGVAYIEMARAAGELASDQKVKKMKNIVWVRPVKVAERPQKVDLKLIPNQNFVDFEVSASDSQAIHANGRLVYNLDYMEENRKIEDIDIQAIINRCVSKMTKKNCYDLFGSIGLSYGPSFQPIQELNYNQNEAIAYLELHETSNEKLMDFVLHPSMLDGALQAIIGIIKHSDRLYVPFSLEELEIRRALTASAYAYVKTTEDEHQLPSGIKNVHIYILDNRGGILAKLTNLSLKALNSTKEPEVEAAKLMYYRNEWVEKGIKIRSYNDMPSDTVLVFDTNEGISKTIKTKLMQQVKRGDIEVILVKAGKNYANHGRNKYTINPDDASDYYQLLEDLQQQRIYPTGIVHLWSKQPFTDEEKGLAAQLNTGIYSIFYLSQGLLKTKHEKKPRLLYVYPSGGHSVQPQYAAVAGFAKSMMIENPAFIFKTISLPILGPSYSGNENSIADIISTELTAQKLKDVEIRYDSDWRRWEKSFIKCDLPQAFEESDLLKKNGVYLISGGVGGLGLIFAEFLAHKYQAKLILTGRSDLSSLKREKINAIRSRASDVIYYKVDISQRKDVEKLISTAKSRFKNLHGIIHSAGVIRDSFLMNKTREEFEAVLKAKVVGTVCLDEATKNEPLDFFVLFSSLTSVIGNIGQCDYAYGNSFMDYYAEMRTALCKDRRRHGKTLSINWPLWRSGGMRVDKQTEKYIENVMGVNVLETDKGLSAFKTGLCLPYSNFGVIEGNQRKIKKLLAFSEDEAPRSGSRAGGRRQVAADEEILCEIRKALKEFVCESLKVRESEIDFDSDLSEYGFDSIGYTNLANWINDSFNLELTPAVFFGHASIDSFSRYLYTEFTQVFTEHFAGRLKAEPEAVTAEQSGTAAPERPRPRFRVRDATRERRRVPEPVAIIGMSGVMPQSENLEEFWSNLISGKDLITEVPADRWDWRAYYGDPGKEANRTNVKWGGFMREVDKFDNAFFGISPREAELMDPQQRIYLETVWKTIEDAGYRASDLSGTKTGLFVGVGTSDYSRLLRDHGIDVEAYTSTGMSHSILANRISYLLNLHGPSEPIDTACSSSLVAVHRGVEAIVNGTCDMAIVGGVNVILDPMLYISFSKAGMLSQDGRCRTFDKGANGYARGEGSGALLLKPLSKARAAGDHVYAVIRGTSENHGGHGNSLTAPNPNAQAELLVDAYERAGVEPWTVSYIEAHGTGTRIGDPIEINALKKAFEELYKRAGRSFTGSAYCGLGSVKTNIGHLETAAGIAGLIKVLLSLKYKKLPANLHFEQLNPYIELSGSPFYIVQETRDWESLHDEIGQAIPKRAGVSSFGFGGSNAHVVLEEYEYGPQREETGPEEAQVIVLSAKNEKRLKVYAQQIVHYLQGQSACVADDRLYEKFKQDVVKITSEISGVDTVDIDDDVPLEEQGLDPYGIVAVTNALNNVFGIELGTDRFVDHSTISSFCQYISRRYSQSLRSYYGAPRAEKKECVKNLPKLADIAYTFQVGREPMQERVAVVVSDIEDLISKLEDYCAHDQNIENLYRGNARLNGTPYGSLLDNEEGKEFIGKLLLKKSNRNLAMLWSSGVDVDWKLFNVKQENYRISLPTYPFERKRYWFKRDSKEFKSKKNSILDPKKAASLKTGESGAIPENNNLLYYRYSWENNPIRKETTGGFKDVIVFDKNLGLTKALRSRGFNAILVKPGMSYRRANEYSFIINAKTEVDYEKLLKDLHNLNVKADFIVHLWNYPGLPVEPEAQHRLEDDLDTGIYSIFKLSKVLIKHKQKPAVKLLFFFHESHDCIQPHNAAISAFFRTIRMENPGYHYKQIRLDKRKASSIDLSEIVLSEFSDQNVAEVKYENNERRTKNLARIEKQAKNHGIREKSEPVYIITGGAGGIGLHFVKHLIENQSAKLVLSGRSDLSEDKKLKINEFKKKGGMIKYVKSDVTSLKDMQRLIRQTKNEFKSIQGVIHAAGIINDSLICNKSEETFRKVIAPKIRGVINIDQATKDESLDFFIVFSSLASVLGNIGQSDYAVGNGFMDSFVKYRNNLCRLNKRSGMSISINWPLWRGGGMKVDPVIEERILKEAGMNILEVGKGLEAFETIISLNEEHVIVVNGKNNRLGGLFEFAKPDEKKEITDNQSIDGIVQQKIKHIFSETLKIDEDNLGVEEDLADYGLDSFALIQILEKMEEIFNSEIDPALIIEFQTIKSLSDYFVQKAIAEELKI